MRNATLDRSLGWDEGWRSKVRSEKERMSSSSYLSGCGLRERGRCATRAGGSGGGRSAKTESRGWRAADPSGGGVSAAGPSGGGVSAAGPSGGGDSAAGPSGGGVSAAGPSGGGVSAAGPS